MKIYNTMSGKKEVFQPINDDKVGMYVCGPTVYDFGHLGHGRQAVSFDVIRKYLISKGYKVTFVTNFTDIDDKMISRAEMMKITVPQLADKIIPEYKKDYAALGIMDGDVQPRATEHIRKMIEIIGGLEAKGFTYVIKDGVYFDVSKFKDYGKLSKQKLDELRSGARVELNTEKRNPQDFVLWKFAKPGEPLWESPWGEGRPGWHIECSAMSSTYLGETFDIHGGGADLTFPHHECEIAQSEGYSGKVFARYWLHNGFIQVNNEKMSKSLGNFFTLRDIFAKFDPQVVRFLFLQTHYRSPIEFTDNLLTQSKNALMRIHDFMRRLQNYDAKAVNGDEKAVDALVAKAEKTFKESMDDDFETPKAISAVFDLIKDINFRMDKGDLTRDSKELLMTFLTRIDFVLGILVPTGEANVDDEIMEMIAQREEARRNRDWKTSDSIRDELLEKGIQLEDSPQGTTWKKV
jgi:cysteinyl-tRNA synthetase